MDLEEKLAKWGIEIVDSDDGGIWVANRTEEDITLRH